MSTATTTKTRVDAFVDLTLRKRALEGELRKVKAQIEPLVAEILDDFAALGTNKLGHDETGCTVYIQRRIWARAVDGDKAAASAALRAAGLGEYVAESFNTNSLSAYFKELREQREQAGEPVADVTELLPTELVGAIELTEDHVVGVRS